MFRKFRTWWQLRKLERDRAFLLKKGNDPRSQELLAVPAEICTREEAEKWASAIAGQIKKRCCLVWSRRISCWFSKDGKLTQRTEAVPGEPNVPWIKIGGKTFLFGDDLGSLRRMDWPEKPEFGGVA